MKEYWKDYNQLQYDRIDKLETKRENFSNYVITLSSALFTIAMIFYEKLDYKYLYVIIFFIIILNTSAIIFNWRTRPWVKLHQKRAELAREKISNEFQLLEEEAKKQIKEEYISSNKFLNRYYESTYRLKSKNDIFRRSIIYSTIHWFVILLSIFSFIAICIKSTSHNKGNCCTTSNFIQESKK